MGVVVLSQTDMEGVLSLPLLQTEYLCNNLDLSSHQNIIITSQKALDTLNIQSAKRDVQFFVIGQKTAAKLQKMGISNIAVSEQGYGEDLAKLIAGQGVRQALYPRGADIAFDMRGHLKAEGITIQEKVVYKTSCDKSKKDTKLPNNGIFIFTSPKIARCFFKMFGWQSSYRAIAIGKSTYAALPEGIEKSLSDKRSIEGCVALAKSYAPKP